MRWTIRIFGKDHRSNFFVACWCFLQLGQYLKRKTSAEWGGREPGPPGQASMEATPSHPFLQPADCFRAARSLSHLPTDGDGLLRLESTIHTKTSVFFCQPGRKVTDPNTKGLCHVDGPSRSQSPRVPGCPCPEWGAAYQGSCSPRVSMVVKSSMQSLRATAVFFFF